jgi:hypothetical protein
VEPGATVLQDPGESIIRKFDWTDWLAEQSSTAQISSSTFAVKGDDTALSIDNASIVTGNLITQFRTVGGTPGVIYRITNTVVTNSTPAETGKRSFFVQVKEL